MTDTKRLRELHKLQGTLRGLCSLEQDEFRSLILAACDELDRLRYACVSTGWLDSETPLSLSNHVVQMYGEACVAQDNAATLRAENEKLRAALEQANRAAEELAQHKDRGVVTPEQFKLIYRMRANRKELIGP